MCIPRTSGRSDGRLLLHVTINGPAVPVMLLGNGNRYDAVTRQLICKMCIPRTSGRSDGRLLLHANINGPAVPVMLLGKATDMMNQNYLGSSKDFST